MCRLFGLHAGTTPVPATFWLIEAPDSIAAQSHRNPDGAGIGAFGEGGEPIVDKQPMAAWQDAEFAYGARHLRGTTVVAHVRYATTGGHTTANTHPFLQDERMFAHNGQVRDLATLDGRLADLHADELVAGETDSERLFALITAECRRCGGDVAAGLVRALEWVSENISVYSLNFVMIDATDLWALRYPAANELYLLDRRRDDSPRVLDVRTGRIGARSEDLAARSAVILASEPMDQDDRWRLLDPGTLVHVGRDLTIETSRPLASSPRHPLRPSDLGVGNS